MILGGSLIVCRLIQTANFSEGPVCPHQKAILYSSAKHVIGKPKLLLSKLERICSTNSFHLFDILNNLPNFSWNWNQIFHLYFSNTSKRTESEKEWMTNNCWISLIIYKDQQIIKNISMFCLYNCVI